jgi:hypothetical protein
MGRRLGARAGVALRGRVARAGYAGLRLWLRTRVCQRQRANIFPPRLATRSLCSHACASAPARPPARLLCRIRGLHAKRRLRLRG